MTTTLEGALQRASALPSQPSVTALRNALSARCIEAPSDTVLALNSGRRARTVSAGGKDGVPRNPRTWRESAPRRPPIIPCDCCETIREYNRKHLPLSTAFLEGSTDDFVRVTKERAELERERREALAYCIECRQPLLAAARGFQYCPYERAGQHPKLKRAMDAAKPALSIVNARKQTRRARARHVRTLGSRRNKS